MNINFMLFDDFETLDLFGPVEIIARVDTHRLHYYSINGGIVKSAQNTEIVTERIANADKKGIFVVPGGRGTRKLVNNNEFLNVVKEYAKEAQYCLSICTGSALLAKSGVLDGIKATSNKKSFSWVESTSSETIWIKHARWVIDGKFYTSSGVSAGIDMVLGFISDIYGLDKAEQIASDVEYLWNRDREKDFFAVDENGIHIFREIY